MCGMCGIWGNTWHWTVAAAPAESVSASRPRMALRAKQAAALSVVAAPLRTTVFDWSGSSWLIQGPSGATEIAETLPQVWKGIELVSGRALDPLAEEFIDAFLSIGRLDDGSNG